MTYDVVSIAPSDGTVVFNSVGYSGLIWAGTPANVHALQWNTTPGTVSWIEYTDGPNQTIVVLPVWAENAIDAWDVANTPPAPPGPPTADENAATALGLLTDSAWAATVDIATISNTPYLSNQAAFLTYRDTVRNMQIYPSAGTLVWPTLPTATWLP